MSGTRDIEISHPRAYADKGNGLQVVCMTLLRHAEIPLEIVLRRRSATNRRLL